MLRVIVNRFKGGRAAAEVFWSAINIPRQSVREVKESDEVCEIFLECHKHPEAICPRG
jgi:hypothetical protein